jgi:hypothetical protein
MINWLPLQCVHVGKEAHFHAGYPDEGSMPPLRQAVSIAGQESDTALPAVSEQEAEYMSENCMSATEPCDFVAACL